MEMLQLQKHGVAHPPECKDNSVMWAQEMEGCCHAALQTCLALSPRAGMPREKQGAANQPECAVKIQPRVYSVM